MVINKTNNNKKRKIKLIVIVAISVLLVFLITIVSVKTYQNKKQNEFLEQEKQRVKQYTSLTDFKSIEEVCLYMNCKFIKKIDSKTEGINYDVYLELPDKASAEQRNYIENLIQYSAYVLDYKNFKIIDEKNNCNLLIMCNEQAKLVEEYAVNGVENYFDLRETQNNIENYKEIETIKIDVTSDILNEIIKNKWSSDGVNLGTKESIYRSYDIYFDEGIQIRKIAGKIFNIVFTDKYEKEVVNNLKVAQTKEQIEKVLGKPQFEAGNLIGYKSKELYVFFYDNQISVYRNETAKTDEIAKTIEKYSTSDDIKSFIKEIKQIWNDYDFYDYNSDYVKIRYALKGVYIKYDFTTKKGIVLYNNYSGKIYGDKTFEDILQNPSMLPDGVYVENDDLVFVAEKERIYTLDDTSKNNNYSSNVILNTSNKFKIYKNQSSSSSDFYEIRFISINNEFPNSELRESIKQGIWYTDNQFIFSVPMKGLFMYNPETRSYTTILKGNENYTINNIVDNKLYYDNSSVEL